MEQYKTEQERFWAGQFGDAYVDRNQSAAVLASKIGLFAKILACLPGGDFVPVLNWAQISG